VAREIPQDNNQQQLADRAAEIAGAVAAAKADTVTRQQQAAQLVANTGQGGVQVTVGQEGPGGRQ